MLGPSLLVGAPDNNTMVLWACREGCLWWVYPGACTLHQNWTLTSLFPHSEHRDYGVPLPLCNNSSKARPKSNSSNHPLQHPLQNSHPSQTLRDRVKEHMSSLLQQEAQCDYHCKTLLFSPLPTTFKSNSSSEKDIVMFKAFFCSSCFDKTFLDNKVPPSYIQLKETINSKIHIYTYVNKKAVPPQCLFWNRKIHLKTPSLPLPPPQSLLNAQPTAAHFFYKVFLVQASRIQIPSSRREQNPEKQDGEVVVSRNLTQRYQWYRLGLKELSTYLAKTPWISFCILW